jgi:hypothetical protein
MHPRTQEILRCLDDEMATLRAAVETVPVGQRGERPAPERWSVAEVLEHLAMVEAAVLKGCSRQLAAARETGLPQETESSSIIGVMPPQRVANRDRVLTAPERLRPTGIDAETAWGQIERTRAAFIEFVKSTDGLALSNVSMPHPSLGTLTLYQWLLFAAGHHARHAVQIREIGQQLSS